MGRGVSDGPPSRSSTRPRFKAGQRLPSFGELVLLPGTEMYSGIPMFKRHLTNLPKKERKRGKKRRGERDRKQVGDQDKVQGRRFKVHSLKLLTSHNFYLVVIQCNSVVSSGRL